MTLSSNECAVKCATGCQYQGQSPCPNIAYAQAACDFIANTPYDQIMALAETYVAKNKTLDNAPET